MDCYYSLLNVKIVYLHKRDNFDGEFLCLIKLERVENLIKIFLLAMNLCHERMAVLKST